MIYIWSTNPTKLGARLIRWGGSDKCSHVAKYYPHKDLIVESRQNTGVREIDFPSWIRDGNKIIYTLHPEFLVSDDELYEADRAIIGRKYDILGILFMAVKTLFCRPFKENKWGAKEEYFCVEILKTHEKYMEEIGIPPPKDWENMYPEEAYEYLARFTTNN